MPLFYNLNPPASETKKPQKYNPLFDPKTDNAPIDPAVQKEIINQPKDDPTGMDPEDQEFLQTVLNLLQSGKIHPHQPSSLINHDIYDKLSEEDRGKVDLEAFNMLAVIRQIQGLQQIGSTQSFQIQNLARQLHEQKERVEGVSGDIFII